MRFVWIIKNNQIKYSIEYLYVLVLCTTSSKALIVLQAPGQNNISEPLTQISQVYSSSSTPGYSSDWANLLLQYSRHFLHLFHFFIRTTLLLKNNLLLRKTNRATQTQQWPYRMCNFFLLPSAAAERRETVKLDAACWNTENTSVCVFGISVLKRYSRIEI